MKIVFVALAAAAGLAAAVPHQHGHVHEHLHHEKREAASPAVEVVTLPGPTIVLYSLNGEIISDAEVKQGIANGTLIWANGAPKLNSIAKAPKTSKSKTTTTTITTTTESTTTPTTTAPETTTTSPAAAPAPAPAPASASPLIGVVQKSTNVASGKGLDADFPDGTIDCSTFPSDYGAINVDYLGLGGWTGIQSSSDSSNIHTVTSGGSCTEGHYCSYACPAGYQKSQWPSVQGAAGQSIGGLSCSGGKLHLTNSALSSKLCISGVSQVRVEVQNNLGQQVAVCRTDYPGTEAETVPVAVAAGETQQLTCPDNQAYYQWKGAATSAQYYVNPAGYGIEDACQWGDSSKPLGNWAPLNLGVGWSGGNAFVSMFPNKPTTDANLDYKVTVTADATGQSCTYSNGAFSSTVGDASNGCTISASSGTIKYVFSSN